MADKTVLLVEDKPSDVRLVMEALKETGFKASVSVVGNGEEAIDFLLKTGRYEKAPTPDLILLDLKLPKKNGHEIIQKVRETDGISNMPIIVLSNSDSATDVEKSYKYRANCYLVKPINMPDFIDLVKTIEKFWLNDVTLPKKHGI